MNPLRTALLLAAALLLTITLVPEGPVEPASAMCYLDPDDPVPGTLCGVHSVAGCVLAVVKMGSCAV